MSALTTAEMNGMRADFETTTHDRCIVAPYTDTNTPRTSSEPNSLTAWNYNGAPIACGLDFDSRSRRPGSMVPEDAEGRIRLPHGTTVDQKARIRLTQRNGVDLNPPWEFEILGLPRAGMTGIQVYVKRVYGNVTQ